MLFNAATCLRFSGNKNNAKSTETTCPTLNDNAKVHVVRKKC